MSLYGHGLLGDQSEVNGSLVRSMSATYNVAYCATDWIGMAEEDVGNAVTILLDLSRFPSLADRLQQGILNFLFLGRLMRHPDGFASDPAFQVGGVPAIDTEELYFDGNSQGAIIGGALCAVARDFRRCVLGEAGMNYSTLLNRSVDFDTYKILLDISYPDPFVQLLALDIIQMLWDRGETNGYAQHLTRDRTVTPHATRCYCSAPWAITRSASSPSRSRRARSVRRVTCRTWHRAASSAASTAWASRRSPSTRGAAPRTSSGTRGRRSRRSRTCRRARATIRTTTRRRSPRCRR